jgi:hypothetical protein
MADCSVDVVFVMSSVTYAIEADLAPHDQLKPKRVCELDRELELAVDSCSSTHTGARLLVTPHAR